MRSAALRQGLAESSGLLVDAISRFEAVGCLLCRRA